MFSMTEIVRSLTSNGLLSDARIWSLRRCPLHGSSGARRLSAQLYLGFGWFPLHSGAIVVAKGGINTKEDAEVMLPLQ